MALGYTWADWSCVGVFAFEYHRLDSVGGEVLNLSLGLVSDAIEIQLQQEMLVWDLVKGFWEVK